MSWYFSHVYDSDGHQRECFWLDHKGNLDTHQDKKDEYIVKDIKKIGITPKEKFPKWLWAHDVIEPDGVPSGADLTEGMKTNGVDQGRTPLGVTFFLPAFKAGNYKTETLGNLTINDFTGNMGKLKWINTWFKQGDNPVIPFLVSSPFTPVFRPGLKGQAKCGSLLTYRFDSILMTITLTPMLVL